MQQGTSISYLVVVCLIPTAAHKTAKDEPCEMQFVTGNFPVETVPHSLRSHFKPSLRPPVPGSWELIIVDNGSKDQTQDVIKNYGERLSPKTVIEPQAGLGRARQPGMGAVAGRDSRFHRRLCYPADDFLYSVVRCFEEDPRLGFIGGRNSPPRSGGLPDYNPGTSLPTKPLSRRFRPSWPD